MAGLDLASAFVTILLSFTANLPSLGGAFLFLFTTYIVARPKVHSTGHSAFSIERIVMPFPWKE
jgi:hypothetical protein